MKGVKYNLVFRKLDETVINMSGLTSSDLMITLPQLFQTHYGYKLNCNKYVINALHSNTSRVCKFVRDKVSLVKINAKITSATTHTTPANYNLPVVENSILLTAN
jgi:hypothetical protein